MFDHRKLDSYFSGDSLGSGGKKTEVSRHTRIIRLTKLLLPAIAALLIGLLILFPSLKKTNDEFSIDITFPKKGELEKLHMENTVFYITDADNQVNNFNADKIDETEPGSKLIKLINPQGIIPGDGQDWVNIEAPVGYFNQNTNILQLLEDVELFHSSGMTGNSTEMFFDFNQSKAYGVKPVTVDSENGHIEAEGFEYYLSLIHI